MQATTGYDQMRRAVIAIASAVLLGEAPLAAGQSDQGIVMPLSDPGRAVTLEVSLILGSVSIQGGDTNEVVIFDREAHEEQRQRPGREGLRRIPNTSLGLIAEERDNTVSITVHPGNRDVELEIAVPRRTSVHARTVNGGDLRIAGVLGEHELANVNGDIVGADVSGSVVAATTNGDIEISFARVTPDKAMSFTSFNGDIEIMFPASLAADLRINAGRGDVLTDFDVQLQPRAPRIDRSQGADGRHRVRLEREVRATVGGGGPEMHFKTFNGDVIIRRR